MGSLVTAVASYCEAKAHKNGQWLLRIEDLDTPRVVKGASDDILRTLDVFGFEWDGTVLYQSNRFADYEAVVQDLIAAGLVYACECTRKSLHAQANRHGPLGLIYPGHCRGRHLNTQHHSLRLNVADAGTWQFTDRIHGDYTLDLSGEVGDVVLKRVDGIYAYHLAVTIDDAFQGINQIVRGADLLEVTPLHLHLNRLLGLSDAEYLHLPLIKTPDGKKLSKQTGAKALDVSNPSQLLVSALRFLRQQTNDAMLEASPAEILQHAVEHWDSKEIPLQ